MKKISILCPTRERAIRCLRYYTSLVSTCDNPEAVEVLFYIDEDDKQLEEYRQLFWSSEEVGPISFHLHIGKPMSVSRSWNIIASACSGDILLMGNDDLVAKTPGWDTILRKVVEEYPDEIYCAFFDDGINQGKHCAFPAISRKWYETVGYFAPGIFGFAYNDTWVFDIAKKIDRVRYIPEVLIKHEHWTVTKEKDATTKRHRDDVQGQTLKNDKLLFERTDYMRCGDAEKLRKLLRN